MKTDKQIWKEWQTKDDMGMRYTLDDRVILAMREFAEQEVVKSKTVDEELKEWLNDINNNFYRLKELNALTNEEIMCWKTYQSVIEKIKQLEEIKIK